VSSATSSLQVNSNGSFTLNQAQNNNSSGTGTFQSFSSLSGTYCLDTSSDSTKGAGYAIPSGSGACPMALVADSGGGNPADATELRLIDTTNNIALAVVCVKQ
jgi:hypothetical protein